MKTIVAGSRSIIYTDKIFDILKKYNITELVCGMASGVDMIGHEYAKRNNIPIKEFPAEWNTFGKSAGYKRNGEMAEYADELIVFWDGISKGTKHMIDIANNKKLWVHVYELEFVPVINKERMMRSML